MIQTDGNVNISVSFPFPHHATIARLLNNALVMQKITTNANCGRVVLTCPGEKQLIGILLSRTDRLAISFSHVVEF